MDKNLFDLDFFGPNIFGPSFFEQQQQQKKTTTTIKMGFDIIEINLVYNQKQLLETFDKTVHEQHIISNSNC